MKKRLKKLGETLALYLDDLLLLAGGGCFVRAAWETWGRPAALAVAGALLLLGVPPEELDRREQ